MLLYLFIIAQVSTDMYVPAFLATFRDLNVIALSCTKIPHRFMLLSFVGRVTDVSSEVGIPEFNVDQMVQSPRSAMETRYSRFWFQKISRDDLSLKKIALTLFPGRQHTETEWQVVQRNTPTRYLLG